MRVEDEASLLKHKPSEFEERSKESGTQMPKLLPSLSS